VRRIRADVRSLARASGSLTGPAQRRPPPRQARTCACSPCPPPQRDLLPGSAPGTAHGRAAGRDRKRLAHPANARAPGAKRGYGQTGRLRGDADDTEQPCWACASRAQASAGPARGRHHPRRSDGCGPDPGRAWPALRILRLAGIALRAEGSGGADAESTSNSSGTVAVVARDRAAWVPSGCDQTPADRRPARNIYGAPRVTTRCRLAGRPMTLPAPTSRGDRVLLAAMAGRSGARPPPAPARQLVPWLRRRYLPPRRGMPTLRRRSLAPPGTMASIPPTERLSTSRTSRSPTSDLGAVAGRPARSRIGRQPSRDLHGRPVAEPACSLDILPPSHENLHAPLPAAHRARASALRER
jgi:hypothetical protein